MTWAALVARSHDLGSAGMSRDWTWCVFLAGFCTGCDYVEGAVRRFQEILTRQGHKQTEILQVDKQR